MATLNDEMAVAHKRDHETENVNRELMVAMRKYLVARTHISKLPLVIESPFALLLDKLEDENAQIVRRWN